jgi:hypothetical protein
MKQTKRPHFRAAFETPIERIFRRIMKRQMTKAELRSLHLKVSVRRLHLDYGLGFLRAF